MCACVDVILSSLVCMQVTDLIINDLTQAFQKLKVGPGLFKVYLQTHGFTYRLITVLLQKQEHIN